MKWSVFYYNVNQRKIMQFNIFDHSGFKHEFIAATKQYKNKSDFAEEVRRSLQYYFWCRSEYEVLICPWPCHPERGEELKVDIYAQVVSNWDTFIDFAWEHRKEVKE